MTVESWPALPPTPGGWRVPARRAARMLARPVPAAILAAVCAHVIWLTLLANSGGDFAAQDAWAEFARMHPGSAYDLAWYGGLHPVSYSILSPYVMAAVGVRSTMAAAGVASAGLLGHLLVRNGSVTRPTFPAVIGALGFAGNAISGRVTFGLGLCLGLAALAALPAEVGPTRASRLRLALGAILAALTAAASPVAGLFLGVAAGGLWLGGRRGQACAVGVPPAVILLGSALLFPFSGREPMHVASTILPVICALGVAALVPRRWRVIRRGSILYAVGVLAAWLVPSPVGTNVTRLALVFAGTVLAAAISGSHGDRRRTTLLAMCLATSVIWQVATVVKDAVNMQPAQAWSRQLTPLLDVLDRRHADLGRVEVVPSRSHREASALAPHVNLARGWNRQADVERNPLFYGAEPLDASSYQAWLQRWAVHYVVLPAGEPDPAGGAQEARLVRQGLPYLTPVWSDADWRVYRVSPATGVVPSPARVERFDAGRLTVDVPEAGDIMVRVPWSPWLTLVDADGRVISERAQASACLAKTSWTIDDGRAHEHWTVLHAPAPGVYRIAAPYHIPRGTPCQQS